jgi:hypothetical protein
VVLLLVAVAVLVLLTGSRDALAQGPRPWIAVSGSFNTYAMGEVNRGIASLNEAIAPASMDEIHSGLGFGASAGVDFSRLTLGLAYERLPATSDVATAGDDWEYDLVAHTIGGRIGVRTADRPLPHHPGPAGRRLRQRTGSRGLRPGRRPDRPVMKVPRRGLRGARRLVLVPVLLGACAPDREPHTPAATPAVRAAIRTDADRYVLRPGPFGEEATIVATFTAPADTTVHVLHCNGAITWGLQRLEGGRWTNAWGAETNGCFSPPFVVHGGEVRTDTLTIVSREGIPTPGPVRHDVPAGTYRVVWHNLLTSVDTEARPLGPELSLENRVSGPITIERAP